MFSYRHYGSRSLVLILFLFVSGAALGQQENSAVPSRSNPVVTAASSGEAVRFSAPGNIIAMRVEIYAATGEKVFDSGQQEGNLLDWRWQDNKAPALSTGSYLCVVTVQSLSGKTNRKVANISFANQQATLQPVEVAQLSPAQTQALGSTDADTPLTIIGAEQTIAATVIAHDGTDGQLSRTRGALSFRLGDFFSGRDKEQMRLTEEGNLGIGTAKPKARLDVAGTVRAREGFMFSDGSTLNVNDKGVLTRTSPDGTNTITTTTQNSIAKFTDNAGTVGDSLRNENGNLIELRALSGNGVNPTVTNPNNLPGFAQFAFYPASGTNTNMSFTAVPRGTGVANNHAQLSVFKTDVIADPNNYEFMGMRARDADFVLGSGKSGTGQNRPFMLASGFLSDNITNNGQLYLDPNGNVGINTTSPGVRLDVTGTINTSTQD